MAPAKPVRKRQIRYRKPTYEGGEDPIPLKVWEAILISLRYDADDEERWPAGALRRLKQDLESVIEVTLYIASIAASEGIRTRREGEGVHALAVSDLESIANNTSLSMAHVRELSPYARMLLIEAIERRAVLDGQLPDFAVATPYPTHDVDGGSVDIWNAEGQLERILMSSTKLSYREAHTWLSEVAQDARNTLPQAKPGRQSDEAREWFIAALAKLWVKYDLGRQEKIPTVRWGGEENPIYKGEFLDFVEGCQPTISKQRWRAATIYNVLMRIKSDTFKPEIPQ